MANKNILITGGAGFIGSHIVERLVEKGHYVKIVDNLSTGNNTLEILSHPNVKLFELDISDFDKLGGAFKDTDVVFHLAAMNRAQRSIDDPQKSNIVNITGTLNCLVQARNNNVSKFISVSSSSVYKGSDSKSLHEGMELEPLHPYGLGKLASEHYCRLFKDIYDLKTLSLRYFSVYGPRQRGDIEYAGVISKFILFALKDEDITIYGDGNQRRNFTFVDDVANITINSAFDEIKPSVINVANPIEISINELAEKIIKLTNSKSRIVHLPPLKADPKRNKADVSLMKSLIKIKSMTSIEKGLLKTIEFLNNDICN